MVDEDVRLPLVTGVEYEMEVLFGLRQVYIAIPPVCTSGGVQVELFGPGGGASDSTVLRGLGLVA